MAPLPGLLFQRDVELAAYLGNGPQVLGILGEGLDAKDQVPLGGQLFVAAGLPRMVNSGEPSSWEPSSPVTTSVYVTERAAVLLEAEIFPTSEAGSRNQ